MNLLPVHADAEGFDLTEALPQGNDTSLTRAFLVSVLGQTSELVKELFPVDPEVGEG